MEGFAEFLVIFKDIFTLFEIKLEQQQQQQRQKNKTINKHFFDASSKIPFVTKGLTIWIDFLWNSLSKNVYFYILYPISFQITWQKQTSQKVRKLGGASRFKPY